MKRSPHSKEFKTALALLNTSSGTLERSPEIYFHLYMSTTLETAGRISCLSTLKLKALYVASLTTAQFCPKNFPTYVLTSPSPSCLKSTFTDRLTTSSRTVPERQSRFVLVLLLRTCSLSARTCDSPHPSVRTYCRAGLLVRLHSIHSWKDPDDAWLYLRGASDDNRSASAIRETSCCSPFRVSCGEMCRGYGANFVRCSAILVAFVSQG